MLLKTLHTPKPKNLQLEALLQMKYLLPGVKGVAQKDQRRDWRTRLRGRSIAIREVDGGSSDAPEGSVRALSNPIYRMERYGFMITASPRQADIVLLTGPLTHNMKPALVAVLELMPPKPCYVITVGERALTGGVFQNSYATAELPDSIATSNGRQPVQYIAHVKGAPVYGTREADPAPQAILDTFIELRMRW